MLFRSYYFLDAGPPVEVDTKVSSVTPDSPALHYALWFVHSDKKQHLNVYLFFHVCYFAFLCIHQEFPVP